MGNIEKLRFLIRSLIQETIMTKHFMDRRFLRLDSSDTDFPGTYPKFRETVDDAINFLWKKVDFDKDLRLAIELKSPQTFTAFDKEKKEFSKGDRIYFLVQHGNELETLVFDRKDKVDLRVDYYVPFVELKNYVVNNNISYLTSKEIKQILKKPVPVSTQPKELIYLVNGKKWVFDKEGSKFFERNKKENSYDVYDILDDKIENVKLTQQQKDEILSYLL
jgi:hypothetical protein